MQSKWKGTCKTCGRTWEAGTEIIKVDDHWCIDSKCSAQMNTTEDLGQLTKTAGDDPKIPVSQIADEQKITKTTQIAIRLDVEAKRATYGNMSSSDVEKLPQQQQKDMSIAKSVLFKGMVEIYKAV